MKPNYYQAVVALDKLEKCQPKPGFKDPRIPSEQAGFS